MKVDPDIGDSRSKELSIKQGAIRASGWTFGDESTIANMYFDGAVQIIITFRLDTPIKELAERDAVDVILYAAPKGKKLRLYRQNEYRKRYL